MLEGQSSRQGPPTPSPILESQEGWETTWDGLTLCPGSGALAGLFKNSGLAGSHPFVRRAALRNGCHFHLTHWLPEVSGEQSVVGLVTP